LLCIFAQGAQLLDDSLFQPVCGDKLLAPAHQLKTPQIRDLAEPVRGFNPVSAAFGS